MKNREFLEILNNIKIIDYDTDGETCIFLIAEERSTKAAISVLGITHDSGISNLALEQGQVDITQLFGEFDKLIDGALWFTDGKGFHVKNSLDESAMNKKLYVKVGIEGLDTLEELLLSARNQVQVLKSTLSQIENTPLEVILE